MSPPPLFFWSIKHYIVCYSLCDLSYDKELLHVCMLFHYNYFCMLYHIPSVNIPYFNGMSKFFLLIFTYSSFAYGCNSKDFNKHIAHILITLTALEGVSILNVILVYLLLLHVRSFSFISKICFWDKSNNKCKGC